MASSNTTEVYMPPIDKLSTIDNVSGSDQVPLYDASNGQARKASMAQVLAYFTSNFASPEFDVTISSPIAGFNQQLAASTKSIWLLLTPAGTLATGTVTLPPVADCFDGQEILVTSAEQITALTVAGNGATVNGAPTSIGGGGFIKFRYNLLLTSWYCVGGSNAFATFIDANGNDVLALSGVSSAVNYLDISNNATGSSPSIEAAGSDTDIGINITAKGVGGIAITGDTALISATTTTVSGVLDVGGTIIGPTTTVAELGSASVKNQRKFVTDSNAAFTAGIGAIVAAGGSNNVPVFSDGTNWRIG